MVLNELESALNGIEGVDSEVRACPSPQNCIERKNIYVYDIQGNFHVADVIEVTRANGFTINKALPYRISKGDLL